MQQYIVRQPIRHTNTRDVYAYEIMYVEESGSNSGQGDAAAANAIESMFLQFSNESFTDGKQAFVTFTPKLLFRNVPHIFDSRRLVIQFTDDVLLYPLAMKMIQKFRKQGYTTALQGFEFNARYLAALEDVDIVKLNFARPINSLKSAVEVARTMNKTVIAYNVDDELTFIAAKELGVQYMQGLYIGTMLPERIHKLQHLQSNFFQLMVAITRDEVDLFEVEEIVSRDVTLTYSLIKLVNSAYFALRNKVSSVRQALVVLGMGQLKQWIYLLSFQNDDELPTEFIKTSFTRASLCSELCPLSNRLEMAPSEAYLLGMFSTLDVILDVPIEEALRELSLTDEVMDGLLNVPGSNARKLLDLVISYERGNWTDTSNKAEELNIPINVISQKYFECMESVNNTWSQLTSVAGE